VSAGAAGLASAASTAAPPAAAADGGAASASGAAAVGGGPGKRPRFPGSRKQRDLLVESFCNRWRKIQGRRTAGADRKGRLAGCNGGSKGPMRCTSLVEQHLVWSLKLLKG
jgi:hypothetical protein